MYSKAPFLPEATHLADYDGKKIIQEMTRFPFHWI